MSGAATELAEGAGPSVLASTSTLELFTVTLFHPLQPLAPLACISPSEMREPGLISSALPADDLD
jgi:hypothetical protein